MFLKNYINEINPNLINAEDIAENILKACNDNDLDWITIVALIQIESTFNPNAKSYKGARGLGQIKYRFWKKYIPSKKQNDPKILYDPYVNTTVIGHILKELYSKFDCEQSVFNYYSGGASRYYLKLNENRYVIQKKYNQFIKEEKKI